MTLKESKQVSGTHILSNTEGGSSQNTEGIQAVEGHSHPVKHRGRVKLGHGKNLSRQGVLTCCQAQRVGVRDMKRIQAGKGHSHPVKHRGRVKSGQREEFKQGRGTHKLSSAEGGSS